MAAQPTRASSPEPAGPLPIKKLQESLINRIAAGEIIHRPASALKELIENSLDAGSTSITITVKDGGMKLLQIQDSGCGIRKSDLPILAERFTTSKLSTFSDLSKLTTYGFRGEALASVSHVAHLSVITKTKKDSCAWKAHYVDGVLVPEKPGLAAEPKPCAGNNGTTIIIEDLFYNTPTRLSALRGSSEEYSRILDVVTRYAIHNPKVAFSCKKVGTASHDISTPSNSQVPHAIKLLYGHTIAKELVHIKVSSSKDNTEAPPKKDEMWAAESYFTNANYQAKKMVFLLFINHRLVESPRIKRSIEAVFAPILPKGASPFVYLSLLIDPRSVDVNVHPTKREVHFLNEDTITEKIADTIQQSLAEQSNSRTFTYQTLLTGGIEEPTSTSASRKRKGKERERDDAEDEERDEERPSNTQAPQTKTPSQHKVRTSQKDRTLDSMFPVSSFSSRPSKDNPPQGSEDTNAPPGPTGTTRSKHKEIRQSECYLASVVALRERVVSEGHKGLTEILEGHSFVGIVELERTLSVMQWSTGLYLVNHAALAEELFYQLGLRQFADFHRLRLEPPPSIKVLIDIAVKAEESTKKSKLTKEEIVDKITNIILSKREMLKEYFAMDISETGDLHSLPLLLPDYTPSLDNLPRLLMRLGPQVNWTSEIDCFDTFLRELALFYSPSPPLLPSISPPPDDDDTESPPGTTTSAYIDEDQERELKAERWQIEHVLFPAMRKYFVAPKALLERDVVQVASLPELYKVFERC